MIDRESKEYKKGMIDGFKLAIKIVKKDADSQEKLFIDFIKGVS
jgi:hypothetical protein